MPNPLRLAVLLSGTGRTYQNLLDRCTDGRLAADVAVVIADRPDAAGLSRGKSCGIPIAAVRPRDCSDRAAFSATVFELIRFGAAADLVCLAGYQQLLVIPDDYKNRVMNIHPALLPAFGGQGMFGERVHRAVLDAGVKVSGCTVHFADNQYDTGPIILQRCVEVKDDDTADTLADRVFAAECEAYPEAIRLFAEGKLHVEGRRVRVG